MREFDEVPVFPQLGGAAVSFAFELVGQHTGGKKGQRTAFRLLALGDALEEDAQVHHLLVEPVRSFLDDVTNGGPGVNGRPLLFLASGAKSDDAGRAVTLLRPRHWQYEYEGEVTDLEVREAAQRIVMGLRDSFCVFESGRIYYVLTLTSPADGLLDEYAAIQLEQLAIDRERADQPGYLGFEWLPGGAAPMSLVGLANKRLASLRSAPAGSVPNGVNDILKPYGLVSAAQLDRKFECARLASLCVAIEDEDLFASARHTYALFDRSSAGPAPTADPFVIGADDRWKIAAASVEPARRHVQEDNTIARSALAVAGLATGVPDFPWQDESEVHDSTRAADQSIEGILFTHPRFMLEVGKSWRSFHHCSDDLGTCPYLLMTWLVCVHDEQTVSEMERMLEEMIYDPEGARDKLPQRRRFRAEPLADVMQLLNSASSPWGPKTGVQERNLTRRLQLFRWESIHRCGDMFRYPKEKSALAAIRKATGTSDRFNEIHETLDRFENLVEDVESLASSYSGRRTNRLLGALAVLGLLSIPGNLAQGREAFWGSAAFLVFVYGAITAAIVLALLWFYFRPLSSAPED